MAVNRFVLNGMSFHGHGAINEIPGIGKKKINSLLIKFGSVAEIAKATVEELVEVEGIGEKHAKTIYEYFHSGE